MNDCVFCRIVRGEIPSQRIFEDDSVIAFLDVGPLADGHTLVVPRKHFDRIENMPESDVAALARVLPGLARAVCQATSAPGLNILQNNGPESGQAVFHVHVHLIPRREGDGLGYRWNAGKYGPGRAEQLRAAIAAQL